MSTTLLGSVTSSKTASTVKHTVTWLTAQIDGGPLQFLGGLANKFVSVFSGNLKPYSPDGVIVSGLFSSTGKVTLKRGTTVVRTGTYTAIVSPDGSLASANVSWSDGTKSSAGVIFNGSANTVVDFDLGL